jgi:peptidoglycan/xylan/chitin deacetylase (PgdA/CDA1 family)
MLSITLDHLKRQNINYMRILLAVCFIQALVPAVYAAQITLSFDDAPQDDGWYLTGNERMERFIEVLREKAVPPVVFYATPRNGKDGSLFQLRRYGEAGHFVANHTNDHFDLDAVSSDEYIRSISTADELLAPIPNFRKWFRFPYLNEGQNAEEKGSLVKNYLKRSDYRSGYVTVEVFDWYVDRRIGMEIKRGNAVDETRWKRFHISLILESIEFYDNLAIELLGRSPVHVVLLHDNDINALSLPELIDELRRAGHTLVSAEKAFADPIADSRWDRHRFSQRRLKAIASESHNAGQVSSRWSDTDYIDQRLKESGLIR